MGCVERALLAGVSLAVLGCAGDEPGRTRAASDSLAAATPRADTNAVAGPPIGAPPPAAASPEAPLEGTEWRLVEMPGAPDPPAGARATLLLEHGGGTVRGSTGCNSFDGAWEIAGTRLSLGLGALGTAACPEALARLEADYLEALRRAGSYRLRGDTLELLGAEGVVARFRAPR